MKNLTVISFLTLHDTEGKFDSQGADTVIYERLSDSNADIKKVTREHLELFGSSGLRTLCLAYRDLSPELYESWNEKFIQAKSSLRDREKKLDEVCLLMDNTYKRFLSCAFGILPVFNELSIVFSHIFSFICEFTCEHMR